MLVHMNAQCMPPWHLCNIYLKKKEADYLKKLVAPSWLELKEYDLICSAHPHCCECGQTPALPRAAEALTKSFIHDAFGTSVMEVQGMRVTLCWRLMNLLDLTDWPKTTTATSACLWWNHQDVDSITNICWMNEFLAIQEKNGAFLSGIYAQSTMLYMCVFQILPPFGFILQPVLYGKSCHQDSWVQNFSSISHYAPFKYSDYPINSNFFYHQGE